MNSRWCKKESVFIRAEVLGYVMFGDSSINECVSRLQNLLPRRSRTSLYEKFQAMRCEVEKKLAGRKHLKTL
jgi:hypothetical protein